MPVRLAHITTIPETLRFVEGQVGFMKSRGFEVHAVSSPDDALFRFAKGEQVQVHPVPMSRRISPASDLISFRRLLGVLRDMRPHIVHAHTPKAGLLGIAAARLARVPVRIYHLHGLRYEIMSGSTRRVLVRADKTACRLATRVICVSRSVREQAIADGICPAGKIKVLAKGSVNGVDARERFNPDGLDRNTRGEVRERFGIPESARVVGFVGRLVADKGLSELVTAWRDLAARYPDARLLVVGGFETQNAVSQEVERTLREDDRIHLVGYDRDTPPLYSAMDVLVLPTHREGFGMTLLEAAAMRLPTVATRVCGCVDAVQDGVTGTLVNPRDARALSDAIRVYLDDSGLRRSHGESGRDRALRDFDPLDVWQSLYSEYRDLLSAHGVFPDDYAHRAPLPNS